MTKIEWTDTSWNPLRARRRDTGKTGWHCEKVSAGCAHCYAETFNGRRLPGGGTGLAYGRGSREKVEAYLDERVLEEPLRWRKPRTVFVCSMSDLFGEWVPDEAIAAVFDVMARAQDHTFQVLTKRPERARAFLAAVAEHESGYLTHDGSAPRSFGGTGKIIDAPRPVLRITRGWPEHGPVQWPLPNVWLGTSCEDQPTADARISHLLATPAAVRFASLEPLLGPVDLRWGLPPVAYTLGNPESYEPALDERGGRLTKCAGGACFETLDAAEAALERSPLGHGLLPRSWFPERPLPIPGRVYALHGAQHDGSQDEVGAARLREDTPLSRVGRPSIDWAIIGGESGPGARPCDVAWIRSLVEQCRSAGVAAFVKQLGAKPVETLAHRLRHLRGAAAASAVGWHRGACREMLEQQPIALRHRKGGDPVEWPEDLRVREFPAARASREERAR